MTSASAHPIVYVGTYTAGESEGIYVYRMDPATGALSLLSATGGIENPTFLAISPAGRHLYAVSEVGDTRGEPKGSISAFAIDARTGGLAFLNKQPTMGDGPCHVTIDPNGRYTFVANYRSGSVAMFRVEPNGQLEPACDFVQHEGSSIDPVRQSGPHAHSITPDPNNRFAIVADLGIDRVLSYRLDRLSGSLAVAGEPYATRPGAGPRHLDFHPNGRYAYLINELDSTVTALTYDGATGSLAEINTLPALPDGFEGTSHCADIHVSADGRFVYGSNRGDDSIVVYNIDSATGAIALAGHHLTDGSTPRNFAIDPSGKWLLAANQNSGTIVSVGIDAESGRLMPGGDTAQVPRPVCLNFGAAG